MEEIIRVENIKKTFRDNLEILKGISFSVEKGEVLSIIGPSGSGYRRRSDRVAACVQHGPHDSGGRVYQAGCQQGFHGYVPGGDSAGGYPGGCGAEL